MYGIPCARPPPVGRGEQIPAFLATVRVYC